MTSASNAEQVRRGTKPRLPAPYLLLLPSALFMALLFGWPMIQGLLAAFTSENGGLTMDNLVRLWNEPQFWKAVKNTFLLMVVLLPLQFALAVGMALLLHAKPKLSGFYFYVWAIPLAVSDLAAGLVWLSIFENKGYLNSIPKALGLGEGIPWLNYTNQTTMLTAVVVAELWRATSLVLIIVVAGLGVIPKDYDEAAAVFGATFWQRLRHVTLPLLRPSLQTAFILRTILALQAFAVAQALTGNNFPLLVGETYNWYSQYNNAHVASAIALVIMLISMVTAVFYLRLLRSPEQEGAR